MIDRERDRPATAGSLDSLPAARPWHAVDAEAVIEAYATTLQGLPETEASARLTILGANRLPEAPPRSAMLRLLLQLHNPLIYVLLGAAALASIIGDIVDALVILGVVLINALIGFIQEGRAEQALKAIQSLIDPRASVIRDGHRITVAADRIVPGDVVLIEAGDRVPADLRLLRARSLRVDESALTGESVPVEKQVAVVADAVPLGERACLAFSGTYVAAGQGTGVAVATGARTELGRISALIRTVRTLRTPLVRQMDRFASQVTLAVLVASVAVLAFAVAMRGYGWAEAFMIVVGIAVAAIPEGLPAIMTITLAVGVQRMARRNAIIRQLPAVETLGSVSVICSDKTGTLTGNEMTVRAVATTAGLTEVSGAGYRPIGEFRRGGCDVEPADDALLQELARAAALCNDAALRNEGGAWVVDGDPMEGALLSLAVKATLDPEALSKTLPRDDEIPFDAAHRFMATLHHSHGQGSFVVVKGAPERVLAMCATERTADGGARPLAGAVWLAQLDTLALGGHRVLAFATKPAPADKRSLRFDDASNGFTMLGLVGLIDPPRPEAIKAVAECKAAGISVRMITGDHGATAGAIARQIGLGEHARIVTGADLDAVDAESLRTIAKEACVFARTSPEHKLRLVEALQADGAVVAMTGDGVNDAPALKRADVGVAMGGKGTEAAKQAAEMVLADDNFASIVAAVREGRTVYDNITKVIAWTLPTNGGEAFTIIGALVLGFALPVTPIQILWINMVTAVALGLTLAFEPTEPTTMSRPPRPPHQPLLTGQLIWRIVFVSVLFMLASFGVFFHALAGGAAIEEARTIVVNTIVVLEIFYLFSVRYVHGSSLTWRGILGTPAVFVGVAVVTISQLAFTYLPAMHHVFGTRPLSIADGAVVLAAGVTLLLIVEAEKRLGRRSRRGMR